MGSRLPCPRAIHRLLSAFYFSSVSISWKFVSWCAEGPYFFDLPSSLKLLTRRRHACRLPALQKHGSVCQTHRFSIITKAQARKDGTGLYHPRNSSVISPSVLIWHLFLKQLVFNLLQLPECHACQHLALTVFLAHFYSVLGPVHHSWTFLTAEREEMTQFLLAVVTRRTASSLKSDLNSYKRTAKPEMLLTPYWYKVSST